MGVREAVAERGKKNNNQFGLRQQRHTYMEQKRSKLFVIGKLEKEYAIFVQIRDDE